MDLGIERKRTRENGGVKKREKKIKKQRSGSVREDQCTFFMEHKQRVCSMQRKKNEAFCSEHLVNDSSKTRVPCPLDPKHSVWERDLAAHVKRCNAKPKESHDPWYRKNANTLLQGYEEEVKQASEKEVSYNSLFSLLDTFHSQTSSPSKSVLSHTGLESWLQAKANHKHILQQSSLIGNLKNAHLLSEKNYYIEFGCGKAELSRAINKCISYEIESRERDIGNEETKGEETEGEGEKKEAEKTEAEKKEAKKKAPDETEISENTYGFGLIDRGVNRMKMDHKLKTETGLIPRVKRSRIDIEHLDLDAFVQDEPLISWVGISKHLCGVATDLTLKSILNSTSAKSKLHGLVVAMCCRHACDYAQLLPASRDYLYQHGICNGADFGLLKKVVSWAVCGRREGADGSHESGLDYDQRERYGFLARSLIDRSRVHAVEALMPGYTAELVLYADTETTLENHCLVVKKVEQ